MHYNLAVFVGRFQPFHLGHQYVVQRALAMADDVLIMIGSSFEPRSMRNPWTFDEREAMIRACFSDAENRRILCKPLMDIRYSDTLWLSQVQKEVYRICPHDGAKITLIGQHDGGQGYYTSLFPQWDANGVERVEDVSGKAICRHLLKGGSVKDLDGQVDSAILPFLSKFMASKAGLNLCDEYEFVETYKKGWENAPFAPTHVTVDTVVIQSGHILMVERGAQPGKGLWALPGGFIQHDETLVNAAIRKLREETKIKVPAPVLHGSIKQHVVFDAPFRSTRGRTITHAFHIELRNEDALPKVKGGGETSKCFWLPLGRLDSSMMFEDHYFIIQKILGTGTVGVVD